MMQGHSCLHIAFQNLKAYDYYTVFNMSTSAQWGGGLELCLVHSFKGWEEKIQNTDKPIKK